MPSVTEYVQGADLADLAVRWEESDGTAIDMSTGYTFSVKVGIPGSAALFTKTSGLTGTTTGVTIAWATSGELNTIATGIHTVQVTATRTSDSKNRIRQFPILVTAAIA